MNVDYDFFGWEILSALPYLLRKARPSLHDRGVAKEDTQEFPLSHPLSNGVSVQSKNAFEGEVEVIKLASVLGLVFRSMFRGLSVTFNKLVLLVLSDGCGHLSEKEKAVFIT